MRGLLAKERQMYRICGAERGRFAVSAQLPSAEVPSRQDTAYLSPLTNPEERPLGILDRAQKLRDTLELMVQPQAQTGLDNTKNEEEEKGS